MEREALKNLIKRDEKEKRKPLIIRGARQVGKSYLINQFKDMYYKDNYILCSFDRDETLRNLFLTRNPDSLLNLLSIKFSKTTTRDTLIILDEIQLCPEALSSLKAIYKLILITTTHHNILHFYIHYQEYNFSIFLCLITLPYRP